MSTSLTFDNKKPIGIVGYVFSGQTESVKRGGLDVIVAKMVAVHDKPKSLGAAFGQAAAATPIASPTNTKVNQSYIQWSMDDIDANLKKMEAAGSKFASSIPALNLAKAAIERRELGAKKGVSGPAAKFG